jgi:peroxiredoxin family protein
MKQEKVAIIINSASYDRVAYALSIASTSAALGKEVHVLFTYGAINRLVKGKADEIGDETSAWIRKTIVEGSKKGSIPKISEMLNNLNKFGGKVYACVAGMALHNIVKDELTEQVEEVTGIAAFLEKVEGASTMLYV